MMDKLLKVATWVSLLGLVILTVIPADERPVSGLQHDLEHFTAFGPVGFLLGFAYARRFRWLYPGAVAFALILEVSQIPLPSRHARVDDFIVDAVAVCLGLAVAQVLRISKEKLGREETYGGTERVGATFWNTDLLYLVAHIINRRNKR
jgi:glycopeptide antibiotics resistance protein